MGNRTVEQFIKSTGYALIGTALPMMCKNNARVLRQAAVMFTLVNLFGLGNFVDFFCGLTIAL